MKALALIFACFAMVVTIHAKEITKEVVVNQATVYLKGAKVTASAQVSLVRGKNFVRLENLPRDLNPNTISISLPKSVDMMSILPEFQTAKPFEADAEELRLLDEIKKNNRQVELLNLQIKTLSAEKAIIDNNKQIVTHEKMTNVEQLEKLTAFYAKKVLEIENALFGLNEKRQELLDKNRDINEKIQKRRPVNRVLGYDVVLELDTKTDQAAEITISYLVENAGWIPSYDIRAKSDKKAVEINYKGKIYQNTGQEWNNIKLSVSSYRPNLNTQRPILHPMYVMEFVEPVYRQQAPATNANVYSNSYQGVAPSRAEEVQADYRLDDNLAEPATWNAVTDSPLSVIYELHRKHSIPSKAEPQHVLLDNKEVPADYVYHVVPSISCEVHLLAKVKNWNELNLMGGEAFLFLGDNFVGKSIINSNYSNDEFPIALGTDERIVVRRTRLADKSETKKLGNEEIGVHTYEITYKNNMGFDIVLEILDQLPVSLTPKIVISESQYGDAEYNETTGALLWKRELAAGKSGKINFSYKITHAKGLKIQFKRK
jgi:uncharacterized protein (TIGR02231 family)